MVRRWLTAAGIACLVAACSLGALDGFSGGATGAPDAAVDSPAGATDATTDTSSGGTDGSVADTGAKSFCASLATPARACLDFDDGKLPLGFMKEADNGGSADFVAAGKDGTGGLVSVSSSNATDAASACIHMTLAGPRKSLVLEADFRVEVAGTQNLEILNLDTAVSRELGVSMTGTKIFIEEDSPTDAGEVSRTTPTTAVGKSSWQRVRLVITIAGAAADVELFVDGISVGTHKAEGLTAAGTTKFEVGDCSLVGAQGWTVYYDNVVVYETN